MKQTIARKLLAWMGWSLEGAKPVHERYVLIAAPHTSNWDFPLMLLFAAATQGWFLARNRIWESAMLLLVAFTIFRPGFFWEYAFPSFGWLALRRAMPPSRSPLPGFAQNAIAFRN